MVSRDSIVDGDWLRATNWCHGYDRIIRTLRNWRNIDGWAACTERTAQGKEFELILMVKMKNRHPVEELLESEFPGICNHCVVMRAWSRMTWKFCEQFLHFFGKATPYGKIFKILLRKFSPPHWSTLLCSNVVKFVRREISEIVRYLPDKKILPASQTVAIARIAPKICQGNVVKVLRISSKLVHFWRSYGQTREHHFLPFRVFPW